MPIQANSPLSSAVANATFLDKTVDDETLGVLGLQNTTNVDSGDVIDNAQRYINEIADAAGVAGEGDATRKVYSSNNYISDGDDHKTAIGTLDTGLQAVLDQIEEGEIRIKAYSTDGNYESANGSPPYVGYTAVYYNTTDGVLKYYDGVGASWEEVGSGGGGVGVHESLGNGDGVTTGFNISTLPTDNNSFIVFRNGTYVPDSQYSFSNPTITFNTAPAAGQAIHVFILTDGTPALTPVSQTPEVEYITISAGDITNKNTTLSSTPVDATKVMVDVIGGSSQHYSVDYVVSGTTLDWNGLGLESELVASDVIRVFYFS